jgi:hypothetical protein
MSVFGSLIGSPHGTLRCFLGTQNGITVLYRDNRAFAPLHLLVLPDSSDSSGAAIDAEAPLHYEPCAMCSTF